MYTVGITHVVLAPPPLDLFAFALLGHASYAWRYGKPRTTNVLANCEAVFLQT